MKLESETGPVARPRILLVAHHYPPHVGGMEIVVQKQAQSLSEAGFDVSVLTSMTRESRERECPDGAATVARVACWHLFENRFFFPFPLFSPALLCEAWRRVKNTDIVHIHDVFYMSSWIAAAFASMMRKPLFLTQHVALVQHSSKFVMSMQRLIYSTVGRRIFRGSRRIIVYNDNVRGFLASLGVPEYRLLQLRNGIDTEMFRPARGNEKAAIRERMGLPMDRPLALFVGRLVEKKGLQVLLDSKTSEFDLVIAGPGPIPFAYRLLDGIHWIGPVDQQQAAALYRACDLFVFPSIGEIFTLTMQEAMASGLPVVTTDDPAYERSPVANCIVRCRRDPEAFRLAIHGLLADRQRAATLSADSRETSERQFDWRANFSTLAEAYGVQPGLRVGP